MIQRHEETEPVRLVFAPHVATLPRRLRGHPHRGSWRWKNEDVSSSGFPKRHAHTTRAGRLADQTGVDVAEPVVYAPQ